MTQICSKCNGPIVQVDADPTRWRHTVGDGEHMDTIDWARLEKLGCFDRAQPVAPTAPVQTDLERIQASYTSGGQSYEPTAPVGQPTKLKPKEYWQAHADKASRVLPCGCIPCICADENRCQGCGAKCCAEHAAAPAANALPEEADFGVEPYSPEDAVMGACGLLDVIKSEWGEAWSEHDQRVRAGLSRILSRQLLTELKQWRTWGVVEIAVRNSNVAEYVKHWEGRSARAESLLAAAQREIETMVNLKVFMTNRLAERDAELAALRQSHAEELKQARRDGYIESFVNGAKWWEWEKTGATMWQSDQKAAYEAAIKKLEDDAIRALMEKPE